MERRYQPFLERLRGYEILEPVPKSRGPEKLAPMFALLGALGHPQEKLRVVHVAGTNGKGLTAAMLANLLRDDGFRVGLYTSPHVTDLRERICLNGKWAAKADLAAAGHDVLNQADRLNARHHFSYFDLPLFR